jgi:hypothetical protein
MKKFLSLFILAVLFSSCQENVKFNSPALQGLKDDVLWRADGVSANVSQTGALTVTAYKPYETLILKTTSANPNTYMLGVSSSNKATYEFSKDGSTLNYDTNVNMGSGEIKISEYDNVNMTVSGSFKFNAMNVGNNPLGGPILNFQYGAFYKVQIYPAQ